MQSLVGFLSSGIGINPCDIKTKLVNFGIKQKIRKEVSTTTKTYFLLSHFQLGGKGFMTQSFQA